jgi:hypothetical protein
MTKMVSMSVLVVEHSTNDPEIHGSNQAAYGKKEKKGKTLFFNVKIQIEW